MPDVDDSKILSYLTEEIKRAEEVADRESTDNQKAYKYYRAKTMDNEVEGRSQIVDTTVFETVEWIMPALEDIFSEENGIPEFEPVGPEDEGPAEMMTSLCRYQFWRQSDGVIPLRQAMKKGLLFKPGGILKYCWEKDVSEEAKRWEGLADRHLMAMHSSPDYDINALEPNDDGSYNADGVQRTIEYDGPRFYSVPDGEFLRHPNARDIKTSPFVAHKTRVTADYLLRKEKEGFYTGVSAFLNDQGENPASSPELMSAEGTMYAQDGLSRDVEHSQDPARKEYTLYECYVLMDADGDGLLENRRIDMINKTILRNDINQYKYPPFVKLCSIDDIDKFAGLTVAEMVMDIQRLRTFLLRQMVDNMAQSNNSRKVYDPTVVNQADLLNNVPGAAIRVVPGVDPKTAITELVTQPFDAIAFNVLEYVTALAEQRTGVSKSVKSVGDAHNETFSGQMAALNQASQRIRMIAKIMATGMAELFRAMVYMNKKFLTQSTYVRLENKFLDIAPDDLEGKMDLVVHVIMGQASRQQTIVNMQQLMATLGQLVAVGIPALDAKVSNNIVREMIKAMGYKNVERFLPQLFLEMPQAATAMMNMNALMGGGNGVGGETMGSLAGTGGGATATTNPSGGGLPAAAIQPGAGAVLQ
jgi:hypothetical protein